MRNGVGGETQWWEAPARDTSARDEWAFARAPQSTLSGSEVNQSIGDIFNATTRKKSQKTCKTSGWAAVYGLRGSSIRKKIIGHGMRSIVVGLAGGKYIRHPGSALTLLQKQAREHGGSVFFHPLIEQSANFLAEIGSVSETRQFKALQGVPRSGKKELPRWLSRSGGHRPPLGDIAHSN
jgi:hypothetical protein